MPTKSSTRRSRESGATLIELLVASSVFSIFLMGMLSAGDGLVDLLSLQSAMSDELVGINVARARLTSDLQEVSTVSCADASTLRFRETGGGPARETEYSSDGQHLVRWTSINDRDSYVADGVGSLACVDTPSERALDIDISFDTQTEYHLHVTVTDMLP